MFSLTAISWLLALISDPKPDQSVLLQTMMLRALAEKKRCVLQSSGTFCDLRKRRLLPFTGQWLRCEPSIGQPQSPYHSNRNCSVDSAGPRLIIDGNLVSTRSTFDQSYLVVLGYVNIEELKIARKSLIIAVGEVKIGKVTGEKIFVVSIAGKNDITSCENNVVAYPHAVGGCKFYYFGEIHQVLKSVIVGIDIG